MQLTFRGWERHVLTHEHPVSPVQRNGCNYEVAKPKGPIQWNDPTTAYGLVSDLRLSGRFLLDLQFDEEELNNWLRVYVRAEPLKALKLLAELQLEVIEMLPFNEPEFRQA